MEKYYVEKISYYKSLFTLCWTSVFILGSGLGWCLMNLAKFKYCIGSSLLALMIIFVIITALIDLKVRKYIKELRND